MDDQSCVEVKNLVLRKSKCVMGANNFVLKTTNFVLRTQALY